MDPDHLSQFATAGILVAILAVLVLTDPPAAGLWLLVSAAFSMHGGLK